jgi:hypothetical protein
MPWLQSSGRQHEASNKGLHLTVPACCGARFARRAIAARRVRPVVGQERAHEDRIDKATSTAYVITYLLGMSR